MNADKVLSFFREITRIPRESGHEELIVEYLRQFAAERSLECHTDEAKNVVIVKEASAGYEGKPTVVIQSHTDMVCEKLKGSDFDFTKDPIKYEIEDGWMIAKETTLGADDGIGVAAELVLLDDDSLKHPKLECLFTATEETGLDGARALKSDFISGKTLINLDNEDEGQLCVGCAGGMDTVATFACQPKNLAKGFVVSKFSISGGLGGHSGEDIDKNRLNAVQQIARFTARAMKYGADLISIEGGTKRNAIARAAEVVLAIPSGSEDDVVAEFNRFASEVKDEFSVSDPGVVFDAEPVSGGSEAVDLKTAHNLVNALLSVPHGVIAMSSSMEGLIETSTNLASVRMEGNKQIVVGTMQRSAVNSSRIFLGERVAASFESAGAEVVTGDGYPGWKPNMDSPLLKRCKEVYKNTFGTEPLVCATHGGLECGLFTDRFPDMDMISFGPTLKGVHAPGEKLELASLDKFWLFLVELLASM